MGAILPRDTSLDLLRGIWVRVEATLRAWNPLPPDAAFTEEAWAVQGRYHLSFWDALIVAAARRLDCRILLNEDLQDGQDLDGVVVRSPFPASPTGFRST